MTGLVGIDDREGVIFGLVPGADAQLHTAFIIQQILRAGVVEHGAVIINPAILIGIGVSIEVNQCQSAVALGMLA